MGIFLKWMSGLAGRMGEKRHDENLCLGRMLLAEYQGGNRQGWVWVEEGNDGQPDGVIDDGQQQK